MSALAFEDLVRGTMAALLATARRLLRNEDEARDAVQAAYIQAWRALPKFRGESKLSTWLHRIVVNESLMRLRARRRDEELDDDLLPRFLEDGHAAEPATDWSESAIAMLEREETRELVQRNIEKLPEAYRTVLTLRDIEELEAAEVAKMLGITTNLVKVRLHRARQALRTLIEREMGGRT